VAGLGVIVAEDSVDNVLRGEFASPEDYLRSFSRERRVSALLMNLANATVT
jgi:hypothetical protein